jgi:anti-sigma B factor antagonist
MIGQTKENAMLQVHTKKSGNVTVLCLDGKLVRGETDALDRAVIAQADASVVVLDLARVNTVDASGLGVMLKLREHTESRGIELRLRNVTQLVKRILEITKLDSVFEMSETYVLSALHQPPQIFLEGTPCA